jgi:hypothetical protein
MTAQEIVVATMTRARDEAEARTLEAALEILRSHGLRVFATDGGSTEGFLAGLTGLPGFTLRTSSGAPRLVRQVKRAASPRLSAKVPGRFSTPSPTRRGSSAMG